MGLLIKFSEKNKEKIAEYYELIVNFIIDGKIIAFPTNSVYGLGGDPFNPEVIKRLLDIKFRDRDKGFLLLLSDESFSPSIECLISIFKSAFFIFKILIIKGNMYTKRLAKRTTKANMIKMKDEANFCFSISGSKGSKTIIMSNTTIKTKKDVRTIK